MFDNLTDGLAWTDVDRKLADTMSSYWVNFARTGNPNGPGLPDWPAHDGMGIGKAIVLGDTVHVESRTTPAVTKPYSARTRVNRTVQCAASVL